MRCVGLHASFIEAKKRLEYKEWSFGYPNEFVPFALDNTGMLFVEELLAFPSTHEASCETFRPLPRHDEILGGLVNWVS